MANQERRDDVTRSGKVLSRYAVSEGCLHQDERFVWLRCRKGVLCRMPGVTGFFRSSEKTTESPYRAADPYQTVPAVHFYPGGCILCRPEFRSGRACGCAAGVLAHTLSAVHRDHADRNLYDYYADTVPSAEKGSRCRTAHEEAGRREATRSL